MPELEMVERPSGAKLGIYALPSIRPDEAESVAPFVLARINVPPGVTTALDTHEVREVWLLESGSGRLSVNGEDRRVEAGDALFYDSHVPHQLTNDTDEAIVLISIWWQP